MPRRKNIKIIALGLGLVILIIIATLALKPFINRLLDNSEASKVDNAFIVLLNEIDAYKSANQVSAIEISDVEKLLAEKDSLKNLKHPQTKSAYQVKSIDESGFISGPEGQKFLNYDGLDGSSFYFGLGTCSNPDTEKGAFLAFSMDMKRTGEANGACKEI